MQKEYLKLLRNPYTGNKLKLSKSFLYDEKTGEEFKIKEGIPSILRESMVSGLNKTYQKKYDKLVHFYDFLGDLLGPIFGTDKVMKNVAEIIEIQQNDKVLETSVGTGKQIENLLKYKKKAEFFGVDISRGMLRKFKKNSKKWNIEPFMVQGNAETLPFADETFDIVFHIGGINFFNDKKSAVHEMVRVAKPGAKIYIGDETEKLLEREPSILKRFFEKPSPGTYEPPIKYIPEGMINVLQHNLWDGKMYLISFEKPKNS